MGVGVHLFLGPMLGGNSMKATDLKGLMVFIGGGAIFFGIIALGEGSPNWKVVGGSFIIGGALIGGVVWWDSRQY